jgi:hypothetical protein
MQGSDSVPSDNSWQGSNFLHSHTLSIESDGGLSELKARAGVNYAPPIRVAIIPPTSVVAFGAVAYTPKQGVLCAFRGTGIQILNSIRDIIQNRLSSGNYVQVIQFNSDAWAFRTGIRNPSLVSGDTLVENFLDSLSGTNLAKSVLIREYIRNLDQQELDDQIGEYSPSSEMEYNFLDVFEIEARLMASDESPLSSDFETLESLAEMCPLASGAGVHRARSVLSLLESPAWDFDDCSTSAKSRQPESGAIGKNTLPKLEIWPNPANNDFKFRIDGIDHGKVLVNISDGLGHLIFEGSYELQTQFGTIKSSDWSNGVYLVRFRLENGLVLTGKIAIVHH